MHNRTIAASPINASRKKQRVTFPVPLSEPPEGSHDGSDLGLPRLTTWAGGSAYDANSVWQQRPLDPLNPNPLAYSKPDDSAHRHSSARPYLNGKTCVHPPYILKLTLSNQARTYLIIGALLPINSPSIANTKFPAVSISAMAPPIPKPAASRHRKLHPDCRSAT